MKLFKRPSFFYGIFGISIFIHLLLIWNVSFLPFIDLPWHLSEATIFKYIDDQNNVFSSFYHVNAVLKPNTFYPFFCSLFQDIEFGNKIFFSLYFILYPSSILLLINELKGEKWLSFFGFLGLYNYNLMWGFVGFSFAIPLVIIIFYLFVKAIKNNDIKHFIAISVLLFFLFFVHVLALIFTILILLLIIAYLLFYSKGFKKKTLKFISFSAPVFVLMAYWWIHSNSLSNNESTLTFLKFYYSQSFLESLVYRFKYVWCLDNVFLTENNNYIFIYLILILTTVYFVKPILNSFQYLLTNKNFHFAIILFIAASFACFILPNKIPGNPILFQRFSIYLLIGFIILLSILIANIQHRKIFFSLIFLSFIFHFAAWFNYFNDFKKETKFFNKTFLKDVPKNKILGGIIINDSFRGQRIFDHYPNYHIVWNKGIATTSLIDFRFSIINRNCTQSVLPKYQDNVNARGFHDIETFIKFDFLLVKGELPVKLNYIFGNFTLIKSQSDWQLYKNNKSSS